MTFCAWLPFQTTLWSPVPESIYGGAARPDKEAKELITYSTSGPAAIWMICMTPLILMVLVRPGSLPGPLLLLVRKENALLYFFFYGVDLILCYFILSNVNWFSFFLILFYYLYIVLFIYKCILKSFIYSFQCYSFLSLNHGRFSSHFSWNSIITSVPSSALMWTASGQKESSMYAVRLVRASFLLGNVRISLSLQHIKVWKLIFFGSHKAFQSCMLFPANFTIPAEETGVNNHEQSTVGLRNISHCMVAIRRAKVWSVRNDLEVKE